MDTTGIIIFGAFIFIVFMVALFKPFKFLEHFDMESYCNHCCINNDNKVDCNRNCYYNGVVCDCCRKYT
jgi:hypothetical protein